MDFCYPLSPLQAFAICLASLDGKVSDSGALHGMKRGVRRMSSGASWLGGKISSTFSRKSKKEDDDDEGGEGGEEGEGGEGRERFVEGRGGGGGGGGGETQEEISGDDEDLDHETLPGEISGGQTSGESKSELSGVSKTMDSMPIIPAGNVREIENKEEGGSGGGGSGGGSRRTGRDEGAIGTVVAVVETGNIASDEEDEPVRPPPRPNRSSK